MRFNVPYVGSASCEACEGPCVIFEEDIECSCNTGFQLSSDGHSCYPSEGECYLFECNLHEQQLLEYNVWHILIA